MKLRSIVMAISVLSSSVLFLSCSGNTTDNTPANAPAGPVPVKGTTAAATLPNEGFKAVITVANPPATMKPGETQTLRVKIKNASSVAWPARGQSDAKYFIKLGDRWFDAEDKAVKKDDGRAALPDDVAPGTEIELPLKITAPATAGDYVMEVDMVQELVAWFRDKGSEPLKLKIKLQP